MKEKVYFEFEAEIQGKQTHFLIEVDKETEDPELRVEDFIHLQHFAGIKNTKGPTLVDAAYAATLRKIEPIATHAAAHHAGYGPHPGRKKLHHHIREHEDQ